MDGTTVGGLAGLAGLAGAVAAGTWLHRRTGPFQPAAHAIAAPHDLDPLSTVLRRGLGGLTVPVVPGPHDELFLGVDGPRPGRTLRKLVLNPLFRRMHRLGADQRAPFRLVVEFAGEARDEDTLLRAYRMLDQQLRDHAALLSHGEVETLTPGAVTVSVTGIVDVRDLLAEQKHRLLFAEASFDDIGSRSAPPALAPVVSEPWTRRFGWDGRDPITAEERHLLHALVRAAHDDERTVRIAGLPRGSRRARRAIWTELSAAGVDIIADTDLKGLVKHVRRHPVAGWQPAAPLPARARRKTPPRPHAPV